MNKPLSRSSLCVALAVLLCACATFDPPKPPGDQPDLSTLPQTGTLTITPNPLIVTTGQNPGSLAFSVMSPTDGDVTARATLALADPSAGDPSGGVLRPTANLARGVRTTLTATFGGQTGSAPVLIRLINPEVVDLQPPPDTAPYFTGTPGGPQPGWAYPLTGAMVPRNFGRMNLQWNGVQGALVYRLVLECDLYQQTIYLGPGACANNLCQYEMPEPRWLNFSYSCSDAEAQLTITASTGKGAMIGSDGPRKILFSPEDVKGGIYYFSSGIRGLYRIPMGSGRPVAYIRNSGAGCTGCHAISRDGKRAAASFTQLNGPGAVLDGRNGNSFLLPTGSAGNWNWAAFNPTGDLLMLNFQARLWVINAETGDKQSDVPVPAGYNGFVMPDWSPDGSTIATTIFDANADYQAKSGGIALIPYNNGRYGTVDKLITSAPDTQHYYPAWTPDSKYLLFNTCQGASADTYNARSTLLRMIAAKPGAQPIELRNARQTANTYTNYPRPSPFYQRNGKLLFFAFSSRGVYGVVKPAGNTNSQIWLSAIDMDKVGTDQDPSFPPVYLPGQSYSGEDNNMPIWTTGVGCLTRNDCPSGFDCVAELCVPALN